MRQPCVASCKRREENTRLGVAMVASQSPRKLRVRRNEAAARGAATSGEGRRAEVEVVIKAEAAGERKVVVINASRKRAVAAARKRSPASDRGAPAGAGN